MKEEPPRAAGAGRERERRGHQGGGGIEGEVEKTSPPPASTFLLFPRETLTTVPLAPFAYIHAVLRYYFFPVLSVSQGGEEEEERMGR